MVDDLSGLGPRGFERMCQALTVHALGAGVDVFGEGPDGGREASFHGKLTYPNLAEPWHGYGVVQAKSKSKITGTGADLGWLRRQIKAELDAWSDPNKKRVLDGQLPEFLIFATNVTLSAAPGTGGKDRIDALIRSYAPALGLKGWRVWDGTTISTLLDSYPDVRQSFSALITSNEVLAAMHAKLTSPPSPVRIDVVLPQSRIRPGQPGHEAAFEPVYEAAGGADVLGEAMGEVRDEGPGWVQHFSGGPHGESAVLVALYGKRVIAVAREVWNELCSIGGEVPNSGVVGVGFPAAARPDQGPLITSDSRSVELAGGKWGRSGRGRLVRSAGQRPVWQVEIVFDSEAVSDRDSWMANQTDRRDLRVRVAGRIPLAVEDWRITDTGRDRMLAAVEQTGINTAFNLLADRYGLGSRVSGWREVGQGDGPNNSRFASYHLTASSGGGLPAVSIFLWFALPAGLEHMLRCAVDLRVDFSALQSAADTPSPAQIPDELRVTQAELTEFFVCAWQVATMTLPLTATTDDLIHVQPAGAPRLELYIQSERPEIGGSDRTVRTLDMVSLSSFGAPRSGQARDLSAGITAPLGLPKGQIASLVAEALDRMTTDAGFSMNRAG
jgi:hypothetical protein